MVRNFNVSGETQRRIKSKRKRILKQSERRTVNTPLNTNPNGGAAMQSINRPESDGDGLLLLVLKEMTKKWGILYCGDKDGIGVFGWS